MEKKIRNIALILIVCFSLTLSFAIHAQAPAGKVDEEVKVAKIILSVLAKTDPKTTYVYLPEKSEITAKKDGNEEFIENIYLGNITNHTLEMSDSERREYIEKFLAVANDSELLTLDAFKKQVRLRARTMPELQLRGYYTGKNFSKALVKPVGNIYLEMVLDSETAVQIVSSDDLENLKLSEESAFEIARKNLNDTVVRKMWTKLDKHLWYSKIEDDYDAARLVAFIADMKLPFKGRLTAYMPAHSVLLVTDSEDPKIIDRMIEAGATWSENMRPLSETLWRYDDGKWHAWKPDTKHKAYETVQMQHMIRDLKNYEEQKYRLDIFYKESGNPMFVSVLEVEKNGDVYNTTTMMVLNSPVSIPKSDRVYLVAIQEDKVIQLGDMAWDNFAKILGRKNLKAVPDMMPARYEFSEQLPEDIIGQLQESKHLKPIK